MSVIIDLISEKWESGDPDRCCPTQDASLPPFVKDFEFALNFDFAKISVFTLAFD